MFNVHERVFDGAWVPSWVRFQHIERYHWVCPHVRDMAVVDAACGSGYGTQLLFEAGARVVGFDLSESTIAKCRATNVSHGVRYQVADVVDLPVADKTIDVYVSFETIEHVANVGQFIGEARRILTSCGRFVCSTPNRRVMNPAKCVTERPFNPFHVREFTADELAVALRQHFTHVEMYGQSIYTHAYVYLLRQVGRISRSAAVRVHQVCKLLRSPLDCSSRHAPRKIESWDEPEILVAVCR